MIIIVDYGMGNLGSIVNMFKKVGVKSKISSDLQEITNASKLVLPGVGNFDKAMRSITAAGMIPVLNKKALNDKIPILGICLGMQLLTDKSEEGGLSGLGWIPAQTLSFKKKFKELGLPNTQRVPHMGWNEVRVENKCNLTNNFYDNSRFYFVHSYYVNCEEDKHCMLKANYGLEFDAAIHKDNIYGMQFHPEKSHKFGMCIFENFSQI